MKKYLQILLFIGLFCCSLNAATKITKPQNEELLKAASGVFDLREIDNGNIKLYNTNYGVSFRNMIDTSNGLIWLKNDSNEYMNSCGLWFGAKKDVINASGQVERKTIVEVTYEPCNGNSMFVPGKIEDGNNVNPNLKDKYRLYLSSDFDRKTGQVITAADGP